jgi:GNAT superfamily N-acetyltransferase
MTAHLEFIDDPARFLAIAGERLHADPVVGTVVATIAARDVSTRAAGIAPPSDRPYWYLVCRDDDGAVTGLAMRTARSLPHPPFMLPMPDDAALALARTLHARGESVGGINGALPAVQLCASEVAHLAGGTVSVAQHTRLFKLGTLVEPRPVPGRLEAATQDDLDVVVAWFGAFMADADEQAGRRRGASPHEAPPAAELSRRIDAGEIWFWADAAGRRVHLSVASAPSFGVARIGPVYTPPEERGRGWASAAVAAVSRRLRAAGVEVCLFTDQANPTSNGIYQALGYEPVVDMANLLIT